MTPKGVYGRSYKGMKKLMDKYQTYLKRTPEHEIKKRERYEHKIEMLKIIRKEMMTLFKQLS